MARSPVRAAARLAVAAATALPASLPASLAAQQPAAEAAGLWSHFEQLGLRGSAALLVDASVVASGGAETGREVLRGLLDLDLEVDGERLLGVAGLRANLGVQLQRGRDGSVDSGDFQVYSNIDGPDWLQVARVFVEQAFVDDTFALRVGKFDSNDDFAMVEAGLLHVHSSPGFTPTIAGFPSYPDPAFGLAAFFEHDSGIYARGAVFDGATQAGVPTGPRGPRTVFGSPSAWFYVGEGGLLYGDAWAGSIAGGGWRHTGPFDDGRGGQVQGLSGAYANWEQRLPWFGADPAGDDGLRTFVQYGYGDPAGSVAQHYFGVGATWTGLGRWRPDDVLGAGVAWVRFRDVPNDGIRGGGEVATELFWRAQVTSWLWLIPDLQWIHDPFGAPDVPDAFVLTLRLEATF